MKKLITRSAAVLAMLLIFSCSGGDDSSPSCPEGFTGTNCAERITPARMYITKVVIDDYPLTNPIGQLWDSDESGAGALPDLFFVLDVGGTLNYSPQYVLNAAAAPVTLEFNPPFGMTNVNSDEIGIGLMDLDDIVDGNVNDAEPIAAVYFQPYPEGNDFPPYISITDNDGFNARVYFTYEWD